MTPREARTTDDSGELVHRFALTMHNLGLARAADELVSMLDSNRWRKFAQGGMVFEFLPGEFDYFLTQQEVTRDQVMAIPDVEAKARLEEAMDERKTGEDGYRRPILRVRAEVPQLPGREITPFGYTRTELKALVNGDGSQRPSDHRAALGDTVRRWTNSGGKTKREPGRERPLWQRLVASAIRLDDADLEQFYEAVQAERTKRRQRARKAAR